MSLYAKAQGSGTNGGAGGAGVTSVGLADGSTIPLYSISGSPVTSIGTLTFTLQTQSANLVLAGPTSGPAAQPTFRALGIPDLPAGNLAESTSSVLTITGGTNAVLGSGTTIQVKQAGTSQSGYLSSTDWNTFNNKQGALTFSDSIVNTAGTITLVGDTLTPGNLFFYGTNGSGTRGWLAQTSITPTFSGLTQYGAMYASSTTAIASTTAGTANYPLVANSASAPTFQQLSLTAGVTGVLPIANGGTNNSSLPVTAGGVVYTDGSKLQNTGAGTSGLYLQSAGSGEPVWAPATPTFSGLTTDGVIYATSSVAVASTSAGSQYQSMIANGSGAPSFQALALNQSAAISGTLPIGNGGTGVTSVTTSPTASAFAGWDANVNLSANNLINGFTTTVTAGTLTTLTIGSTATQVFTGSTTQTIKLPTTSVLAGLQYTIINLSSGSVTVESSGTNTIQVLAQNTQVVVTALVNTPTTAANWNASYTTLTGEGTVTSVAMTVPAFLSIGGSPITTSGTLALSLSGTALPIANGGTGTTSTTQYGVVYGSTTSAYGTTAAGSTGQVLQATTSSAPTWGNVTASNFGNQSAGTFLAGPTSGSATTPTFRALQAPTISAATASGTGSGGFGNSQTGWLFTISTTTTCAIGDTYTNNSNTYTVQGALSAQSGTVLFMSGTGATSGTTLTRATGSGTSSVTFSAKVATYTYTTPAGVLGLEVSVVGGGGGGGEYGSGSASGGAGGGGGGGTSIKYISSPAATYPYVIGTAGGGGSGGGGSAGTISAFGANIAVANGGSPGSNATSSAGGAAGGAGGTVTFGDIQIPGAYGGPGQNTIATVVYANGGKGGDSKFGFGGDGAAGAAANTPGNVGVGYGAGGQGGSGASGAGGNGTAGYCFVKEVYQ